MDARPWIVLFIVAVGNCGFWLYWFNRINSTGLIRRHTKIIEKCFVLLCFLFPLVVTIAEWPHLMDWLLDSSNWWPEPISRLFRVYGAWCVASFFVLGIGWLESRLWLIPPKHQLSLSKERHNVHNSIDGGSPGNRLTKVLNKLPGNQICHLEVTRKELLLPRSLPALDGFKIGHLSDLHFTGQFRAEHYRFAFDRFNELQPDLIIISGDIIDYDRCLPWIDELLPALTSPFGCSVVLGNHDRRLTDIDGLSNRLTKLGFHDLGRADQTIRVNAEASIYLSGNELPWLHRKEVDDSSVDQMAARTPETLRLAVSHSPDQLPWARRNHFDLMLAGHTHGGQVRFPGIGPIVAPSLYGSRYASGLFYKKPTLMHVSRGIAGTHPLRWWCRPEASLLTLRSQPGA
ncbi:MAG: metallophosphoesterase [Planctomycetota bacterium]